MGTPPWPSIDGRPATAQELADFYFDMGRRFGEREQNKTIDRLAAALLRFTNIWQGGEQFQNLPEDVLEDIHNQAAGVLADLKF